jgi:diguanylate cyclase (GGDEF)-like protein
LGKCDEIRRGPNPPPGRSYFAIAAALRGRKTGIRGIHVRLRYIALLLALSALAVGEAHGAMASGGSPMYFEHLSVRDGMSQSAANVIFQDSQGFIWIGTESGLNRYDGHSFKRYQHRRDDPNGLPSDFVWEIAEDAAGDLWLATAGGGVVRWNRRRDDFTAFPIARRAEDGEQAPGDKLSSGSARAVEIDADGIVWVATRGGGLNRLDPATGAVTVYRAGDPAAGNLASDEVMALLIDHRGWLWVGTDGGGLHRLDPQTGRFARYAHDPENADSLSHDTVTTLHQDADHVIWVGTFSGGLNKMMEGENGAVSFERFTADPNQPDSLSRNHVRAVVSDERGRLWVGTEDGLNLLDQRSGTFRVYRTEPTDPNSLADSYVMSLFQDRAGLLWVGTRSGGVSRWNPRSWSMGLHSNSWLRSSSVTGLAARGDGSVWIGTLGAGLALLDPITGRFETGTADDPLIPGLRDRRAMTLLIDSEGDLWIGTMTGGLHNYDAGDGKKGRDRMVVYTNDKLDVGSLSANGIMSLLEDHDGRIWVGTHGGGVSVLDRITGKFIQLRHDPSRPESLSGPRATTIAQTPDGAIWVGTDDAGLNLYDPLIGGFHHFRAEPDDSSSLPSDIIYTSHVDDAGTLWLGTARGDLVQVVGSGLDPEAVRFEVIENISLRINAIYGIQSDSQGTLWMSTSNGLWRYQPRDGSIKSFGRSHGLQGEEFNFGAHTRGPNGMLYFGGSNGLNAFFPEAIEVSTEAPPVVVSRLLVLNTPAQTELPHPLVRSLELGHADDMLSIEFAALDFTSPEQNRYAYRLDGFDREWNDVGPLNYATYTNLDAGHYTFRVKAANSDGVWNEEGVALDIRVRPAPWETIWAYLAYIATAVLLVFGLLRWQKLRHERAAEMRRLENFHPISGLPNRKLFGERLAGALEEARQRDEGVALLHIDLDKFKRINDTLGQAAGDAVLKMISSRLAHDVTRSSDGIGRREIAHLGGDEFVVFVRHQSAAMEADKLGAMMRQSICTPIQHGVQEFVVSASIGIAMWPEQASDSEELLGNADTATYKVKQEGGNGQTRFAKRMNSRAMQRFELENDLRNALKHEQLEIYFQPKFSAVSFELVGAEALLRWKHPTRGFVSPAEFIPIAEESGLIGDFGHFVTYAACQHVRMWQNKGLAAVPIAINLSAAEFHRGDPVETLRLAADVAEISPSLIEVEITESMLFHDVGEVRRSLDRMREFGFRLSVDDFGTGYSSLGYLRDLPLDALKIDRQFVSDIGADAVSGPICDAIIGVAHSLGLRVIAEGIETEVQIRALQRSGCDEFQGFLLAKPIASDQFERWLSNRKHPLGAQYELTPSAMRQEARASGGR